MTTNEHAGCIRFCRANPGVVRCDKPADGAAWGAVPSAGGALTEAERVFGVAVVQAGYEGRVYREADVEGILAARSQRPEGVTVTERAVSPSSFYREVKAAFDLQCPPGHGGNYVPGAHMAHQWWTTVLGAILDRYAALADTEAVTRDDRR